MRLLCYSPHYQSILDNTHGLIAFPNNITVITRREHLAGLVDGCSFIHIEGHPASIPEGIMQEVERLGMTVITIDDTYARNKYARERK